MTRLSLEIWKELEAIAQREGSTVAAVLRRLAVRRTRLFQPIAKILPRDEIRNNVGHAGRAADLMNSGNAGVFQIGGRAPLARLR